MNGAKAQRASQLHTELRSAVDLAQGAAELQQLSQAVDTSLGNDRLHFVDLYCTSKLDEGKAEFLAAWLGCSISSLPSDNTPITAIELWGKSVQLRGLNLAGAGATPLDVRAPIAVVIAAPSSPDVIAREQVELLRQSFSITPIVFVGSSFATESFLVPAATDFENLTPRGIATALACSPEDAAEAIALSDLETIRRIATAGTHIIARRKQRYEADLILVKDEASRLQSLPIATDPVGPLSQELAACDKTLEAFAGHMFDHAGVVSALQLAPEDIEERDIRQGTILHSISESAMQRIRNDAFAHYRAAVGNIGELLHMRLALLKAHADRLLEDRGHQTDAATPPSFYPAMLLTDLEAEANAIRLLPQQTQLRTLKSQISMANPLMVVAPLLTAAGFWMSFLPIGDGGFDPGDMRKLSFGVVGTVGAMFLIYSMVAAFPRRRAQQEADREQVRELLTKGRKEALSGSASKAKTRVLRALSVHFELVEGWIASVKTQIASSNSGGLTATALLSQENILKAEITKLQSPLNTFRSIAESAGAAF